MPEKVLLWQVSTSTRKMYVLNRLRDINESERVIVKTGCLTAIAALLYETDRNLSNLLRVSVADNDKRIGRTSYLPTY